MEANIFIPKRCKVGFNLRSNTYTGKLGYVIYHDGKVWRKEASWESWRQKRLSQEEFDNEPLEGFVLNRKAGGYATGWNHRQTYCRVYDPRGFEFEISIPNLLYILENSNSIKGKGLEGKFIYGWDGKDLVLLPENSPEFQKNLAYTDMQDIKLKKADLVVGGIYLCKDNVERTFMGESNYYDYKGIDKGKKLWFWEPNKYYEYNFETYPIDKPKVFVGRDEEFSTKMELLINHDRYKQPELEYEEVTIDTLKQKAPHNYISWYSNRYTCYILVGKKYKEVRLELYHSNSSYKHRVIIGRQEYEYSTLEQILANHKLWQITKTTKES